MTLSTEITRKQDLTNDTIYANNDYPPVICLFFQTDKKCLSYQLLNLSLLK